MPKFYFFNIKIFLSIKFEICAYPQLENNFFLNPQGGPVRDSTKRPKIWRFWRKGYRKN